MSSPSVPKGTRDFTPQEVFKRNYIFNTIRKVFELFGYAPIETPTMEMLSTLTGKYGDEGDKLLFKILNSGDFLSDVKKLHSKKVIDDLNAKEITNLISEKGLRYDLTVPFARYVVMHRNEIALPFRRYQIQSVFRADRPQKGRYREFYQCDADVVGSESLWNEVEFIQIYDEAFKRLNLKVEIKINNRKVLSGLAEIINAKEHFIAMTTAIDKLDKVGLQGVRQDLASNGFSESQMQTIERVFAVEGNNIEKVKSVREILSGSSIAEKGCDELLEVLNKISLSNAIHNNLSADFTLARGLNYYTGCIYEVVANEGTLKLSIGGGGRYDDLTGIFGWSGLTGVGISFGADRIYDVIEETNKFPENITTTTKILFINFGNEDELESWKVIQALRLNNISAELYHTTAKIAKQFKYAEDKKIPFVAIIGEDERKNNFITIKNQLTAEQKKISIKELIEMFA
jgi:histidyl-tRNA synthetase